MTIALEPNSVRFDPEHFGTLAELRESTASGTCEIVVVACSDHGAAPDAISFGDREQFLILQGPATMIPGVGDTGASSVLAGIEYAVCELGVKHAVVCQHVGCRIIPHWLSGVPRNADAARFRRDVQRRVDDAFPNLSGARRTRRMIREHLLVQLKNLQSHERIRCRLDEGSLRLHGWLVHDRTARIRSYDPQRGRFVPIEQR